MRRPEALNRGSKNSDAPCSDSKIGAQACATAELKSYLDDRQSAHKQPLGRPATNQGTRNGPLCTKTTWIFTSHVHEG